MFSLAVRRSFSASHFLIGGDWGAENQPHSHDYRLEVELEGERLDQHGFLVDLVELERQVDALLAQYQGRSLNELAAFAGLNPSLEHFSRIFGEALDRSLNNHELHAITVRLWEDEAAWASFRRQRR
ncbi:MAG: 6-carboxytetrahydropterin synthase [Chloroflexota bacterium]